MINAMNHITLGVIDIEKSFAFYRAGIFIPMMGFTETCDSKLERYNQDVALNEVRYRKNILEFT